MALNWQLGPPELAGRNLPQLRRVGILQADDRPAPPRWPFVDANEADGICTTDPPTLVHGLVPAEPGLMPPVASARPDIQSAPTVAVGHQSVITVSHSFTQPSSNRFDF
jgi:hypothetical protein